MSLPAPGLQTRAVSGIPVTLDEITPDWLTEVLGQGRVLAVDATRIGEAEGFTGGALYRITLRREKAGPLAVVVKLSPRDPAMRTAMRTLNGRESQFYARFSDASGLPVPQCHYAAFDRETGASILVLEDLTAARAVPFAAGCGYDDALRVVSALAAIHARLWNSPALQRLDGSAILQELPFQSLWTEYPARLHALLPDVVLPTEFLHLGDEVARRQDDIFARLMDLPPLTCLHRDLQIDNVMFAPTGAEEVAVLLDWQLCGTGRGACDLAYFLISSLEPPLRRQCEDDLVARYHALLVQGGVEGYSLADCREDYVLAAVSKLFITVAATVLFDNSGPAKAEWRAVDLRRLLAFCADHRVLDRLPGRD